jgi:hypothetical protein
MAITYVTPTGTVLTTIAQLADYAFDTSGETGTTPTTATVVVYAHRKPGTPVS